ncbi:RNA methyltransferase [Devosia sp. BK]|uniref:RNA methyltransferase n=1 Tax=unclassified Devosia TaxID=196773 RepID=UPI0007136833|nr:MULTISPECIES: RNA methyltransferase [unclassified Devosia]KQN74329.1 RNA methyltransferase [Devosia sp. Leaf64]KQT45052.1 RNA methyltransferase [Devosia sp. Leaf420]MDV3250506.1 RNA methyltransferase [Devosia sp. BK]
MAGTDTSLSITLAPGPAIILCEPQLGENIGTAARAMANFGLWDLRLVRPRDGWPNEKAVAAASRADHVLERVRVFETLEDAIADLKLVYATTARSRDMQKEVLGPEEASINMAQSINAGQGAGLLFGRERWGLLNDEVAMSDAIVTLPVEPAFASLNIAQAVLLMAYEWRRHGGPGKDLPFGDGLDEAAPRNELVGLFEHLEGVLDQSGFFTTPDKRPSMVNNLRTALTRGRFTSQEIRTLRGVISSIDRRHERPNPNRQKAEADKPITD